MITEMISKYAYEAYKIDWKRSHEITAEIELKYIKDYYEGFEEEDQDEDYSFEEYLEEVGYGGECYVCYDEFLDNEYLDTEYIEGLLKMKNLIRLYRKDIKENFDNDDEG